MRVYVVIWLYSQRGKMYALGNTTLRSLLYSHVKYAHDGRVIESDVVASEE